MKQILGFLLLAIKWLSKSTAQIKNHPEENRYVLVDDIMKAIELACYQWMHLSQKYWVIIDSKKRKQTLHVLHLKIQTLIKEHPELNGFDVRQGSPFFELVSKKALNRLELIEKHGQNARCIEVELLKRLVITIITYNFFKKHKERAVDLFAEAESKMRELVEEKKLPGRFSWNTFVSKDEEKEQKEEIDPAFLDIYGESTQDTDEQGEESNPDWRIR